MKITETAHAAGKLPTERGVRGESGGTKFAAGALTVEGAVAAFHVPHGCRGNTNERVGRIVSGVTKGNAAEFNSQGRSSRLLEKSPKINYFQEQSW